MSQVIKNILKNGKDTTIIETVYHIYIDTLLKLDKSIYGTIGMEYNVSKGEEDLLSKKFDLPEDIRRDVYNDKARFLYVVNKTNISVIKGLVKLFNFNYNTQVKDERETIINNNNLIVINYSEKSVALFLKENVKADVFGEYLSILRYNSSLTGPDMKKKAGYILAKSNKKYKQIMDLLDIEVSDKDDSTTILNQYEQLDSDKDNVTLIKISGENTYIKETLEVLIEDSESHNKVSEEKINENTSVVVYEIFF